MGAWGTGPFENDDAADWVYELEADGIAAVDLALSEAFTAIYLEAPTASAAIAAGEVVAAALAHQAAELREDILKLAIALTPSVTPEHAVRARTAAERVLVDSELAELWAESNDDAEWRESVGDLVRRLGA